MPLESLLIFLFLKPTVDGFISEAPVRIYSGLKAEFNPEYLIIGKSIYSWWQLLSNVFPKSRLFND